MTHLNIIDVGNAGKALGLNRVAVKRGEGGGESREPGRVERGRRERKGQEQEFLRTRKSLLSVKILSKTRILSVY